MTVSKPFLYNIKLDDEFYCKVHGILNRGRQRSRIYYWLFVLSFIVIPVAVFHIIRNIHYSGEFYSSLMLSVLPSLVFINCAGYFHDDAETKNRKRMWKEFQEILAPYISHIVPSDKELFEMNFDEHSIEHDLSNLERYATYLGICESYNRLLRPDYEHEKETSALERSIKLIIAIPLALFGSFLGGALMGSGSSKKESTTLSYAERNKIKQYLNMKKNHKK